MFKIIALVVAGLLWSVWLFAKLRECEGEPLKIVLDQFSRLGWFSKIAVLFFVVQLTMFGGAKHGTNDVDQTDGPTTNDVGQVEGDVPGGGTNDVGGVGSDLPDDGGPTNAPPLMMGMAGVFAGLGEDAASTFESRITEADYDNGYVLYRVGTNETHSFAAPDDAVVATNWILRGAAKLCVSFVPTR